MDKIDDLEVAPLTNGKFVKPYLLTYTQNNVKKVWEVTSVHPSVAIVIFNSDQKKLVFVKQFRPAVYFSSYPRHERELETPCSEAASNSSAPQASQQTQTQRQVNSSQETQTACSQQAEGSKPCVASEATQSASRDSCSQATQSVVASQCTQSSQCCAATTAPSTRRMPALPGSCGITLELCAGIVDKDAELRDIAKDEVLEECGYDVSSNLLEEIITIRSEVGIAGARQTLFYVEVTDAMKTGAGGGLASEGELIEVVALSILEARQLLAQKEAMVPAGLLAGVMWFFANKADKFQ